MAALENKFTLEFLDFYFPYILWVDDSPAISFNPTSSSLAANLPQPNSNTNKNNKIINLDSEDELNLPLTSFK